jgi:hypothetical protein
MKLLLTFTLVLYSLASIAQNGNTATEILILGTDHLSQVYNEEIAYSDALSAENQASLNAFAEKIAAFNPDMIMVEQLPSAQQQVDSLYKLYTTGNFNTNEVEYPRSELYQLAFPIGQKAGVDTITCVNSKGGTSQSLLSNGDHIELYKQETAAIRKIVGEKYGALYQGKLSFEDYLYFLNQPEAYQTLHRLKYITPARVTNGHFSQSDEMVDSAFINPKYIGAELISVWKNRDYKIYSNIVTNALEKQPKRILVIIGVGHVGSLRSIFRDDYEFKIVEPNQYLKNS